MDRIAAFAPPSIGNFGPGLDILGCAIEGAQDLVIAEVERAPGNAPVVVRDAGHPELPQDADRHASAIAARAVLRAASALGAEVPRVALTCRKGLPLAAGQGGSAASAVAGAVAVNALLGSPLGERELLSCALEAEAVVAGRHLDNLAPALLGGIVLIRSVDPIDVVRLPTPADLRVVLAYPRQRLRTAEARAVLPASLPRGLALHQAAQVAAIVAALYADDLELLGRAIDDQIAEPARAPLLPGFVEAKAAALSAGALGASISGAGPTAFALAAGDEAGERIAAAMRGAYRAVGMDADTWVTRPGPGARTCDPDTENLDT